MKKPTTLKSLLVVLFFIQSFIVFSQKNFTARFDQSLKGDMLLIGNNILNRDVRNGQRPNDAFNATDKNNNDLNMQYVDVDNDNTTFSSSSANLVIPTGSRECYKIVYAGLYWAGIYSKGAVDNGSVNRANLGSIKFKLPGQTTYNNITGSLIYDYYPATSNGDQMPYAYYYNATSLVQALANPEGTYTAANIIAATGTINGGYSAGWNLFIVYEDPKSSAKYITTFDGFRWIQANSGAVTYDISGFKTIPTGVVKSKLAFAALEGDVNLTGDRYAINNTDISTTERAIDNFFNSTINDVNGPLAGRSPNSGNTLGFEAGIINLNNASNSIIKNNDTSAQLKLSTGGDGYGLFFNAFNVEIIEPKIVLTKIVKNAAGVNIGGQNVTLGQQLNYEIGFKNTGNDNATSFTIRDQLPINIIFNYPTDIVSLPSGVTIQSYNPTTRNIVFAVDNNVVKVGDPEKIISFKVQVVPDCHMLSEACSNSIDNSAYATYKGTQNTTFTISDDPSVNTNTGCILVPKATNFLVGVDGCKFTENVTLCGESINLVAANGYTNYTWYSDEARTNQIGTGQTFNVKNAGTYYVYNLAAAPCRSIYQSFVVTRFGNTAENPVIPFADQVVTCSNDGKKLPNIFLCGANASRQITTNISDATSIVWEKLNEGSCTAVTNQNCANESDSCKWAPVGSGANYTASIAGQYRLTLNYSGGCFNRFYFNVFTNSLNATETHEDIICGLNGKITINGVPAGYEYALSTDPNGAVGAYQTSNIFTITNPNSYTVHIRQIGVTSNPCIFKVPGILIRKRDLQISTLVTQPSCFGEKGTIKVGALNIDPQYYYTIYDGNTVVNTVGPVSGSDYTFNNLTPGITYRVRVTNRPINSATQNCDVSEYIYIQQPVSQIVATAALVEPLTACSNGKIVISATGGNFAPYYYFINGSATFQTSNEIVVTAPGKYDIRVVDSKNCETTTSITVASNAKPTYTITNTNSNCYNDNAQITVNVSNANGYSMSYSINNGATYQTNPVFSNLQPGTYNVVVRYGISYTPQWQSQPQIKYCTDPAQQVIIAGPTSAVTASGGVAELAGCTLSQQGGKLRINNAQGGTAPYQYSFDGGATWQASNEKDVLPGSYILKIKDALGCEYTIPYDIILDQKPSEPTIKVEDPVFNCSGSATSTVTVTNGTSANYTYEYYLNGVANTPITNNVFLNVPSGSHTVSVKYNVTTVSTYSNLLQEDFGKGGYTTTPGINPAYCFEDETSTHLDPNYKCNKDEWINDGEYAVASSIRTTFSNSWIFAKDHTVPASPIGRFLCVNVGGSAGIGGILYSKPIKDVIVNQPVIISLWAENLIVKTSTTHDDPKLTIQLVNNLNGVGGTETIVATTDTSNPWRVPKSEKWEYKELSLNPGAYNNLSFVIRSYSNEFNGNDVLIDDIWVRQIPKSCIATKDFPIVIDSNKGFTASVTGFKDVTCNGGNNGEITIAAQNFKLPYGFDYSLDNGVTWINAQSSPVTATGLTSKTYNIQVRFDASATSCIVPLTQQVKAPTAVTITATVTKQPTCTTGATITAVAAGGTPAYQYELRQSNGSTVVTAFQSSGVFTNVPAGTYTVVTRDANSCSSPASTVVTVTSSVPPTATLAATSDLCYDTVNQSTLVVSVTGGTGALTYSLDGQPAQTSNTFTNVGPGTHNIVVTDSNSCTSLINNIVIAPQLLGNATISKTLDCTNATPDATITVNITGGNSPFTYKVKRGTGAYGSSINITGTSFVYSATTAGTYTFEITDSKGCITTVDAIISPISNPTVTATPTQITCNGLTNGSVQLIGAGGSGGYEYNFNNLGWSTTSLYSNLSPNVDYTYLVRDSKGCSSASATIRLTQPTVVTGTISATALKCNGTGTTPAVVTVTGAGGTGAYSYSFNGTTNFTSANTFSTSTSGVVTAYIRDANNCQIGPLSVTIDALDRITGITLTDSGYDCSTNPPGGHVNIAAVKTDVSAPIRFQIISGPAGYNSATNSDGEFKSLTPGDYVFQATDIKTGCSFTLPYTVKGSPDIITAGSSVSNIQCNGGTGTLQFTVNGVKNRGYDYVITNAGGTIIQQDNNVSETTTVINVTAPQPAGTYTITATDRLTKCQSSFSVTITQPGSLVDFTATATNVNCNNDNSQITVTATGGTPNYTYAFAKSPSTVPSSAYGNSAVFTVDTNSGADLVWDIYVKDVNGCTTKKTITVVNDNLPTVTASINNQCAGSGNTFTITAVGTGLAPLTYSIDGTAFQTSNTFNVPAGTYIVTVKDKNGCTATTTTPLIIYPQLTAVGSVTKELDCTLTPNATITVTISGGKGPFTYTSKKGSGAASAPSASIAGPTFTFTVSPTNADTYTFVITDANGCQTTAVTKVDPIANPTVTAVPTNASCNAAADGSVTLTGAGGSGGFTYSNNATSGFTVNPVFTGLIAGSYTFYVKDSKGCLGSVAVTITQPSTLAATVATVPFTCNTSNAKVAGTVTINVTALTGTAPYEYSFNGNGFSSNNVLTLNDNGADQPYTYSVRDAKGCSITGSGTLSRLNPPTDLTFAAPAVTCTATTTTVALTATNGVATLQYETIAPSAVIIAKQTSNTFANLAPGSYTFRVTDANGCYYTEPYVVNPVTPITVVGNKISDVLCRGGNTGSGTYTVSGNATVGNYTYTVTPAGASISKSGNTLTLSNAVAGTYTVVVTDTATGCTNSASIVIAQPAADLVIDTAIATNVTCNNENSQITITATGGTPNYTYAFAKSPSTVPTSTYGNSAVVTVDTNSGADLVWDVYVKDANGCITKSTVTVILDAMPTITNVTVNNQCTASGSGFTITATATGLAPLTYSIDGTSFQTSNTFTVAAGTYTVSVKDKNGCIASAPAGTVVYPQLTAVGSVTKELDCTASPNATITVTIGGGKSTFTYTVQKGAGTVSAPSAPITGPTFTYTVTPANADTYTFVITDANGCQATSVIKVDPIANPTVTAVQTNAGCNGAADGSVTLTGAGGSGGFTYSNNPTSGFTVNPVFTGLIAGSYTFYVKDSKDCTGSVAVTITQPLTLVATVATVPFSCNTTNGKVAGSVTINVTAGTGTAPYQYSFNGNGFSSNNVLTLNDNGADQPYTYAVRDAKGCPVTGSGTLLRLNPPTDLTFAAPAVTCTATTTTVTLTATNGVAALQYETIAPSPVIIAKQTSNTFANLAPGTYMFKVTDANGCYYTESFTVSPVTPITAVASKLSDVLCNGGNTGSIRLTVGGFASTYSYTVNGGTAVTGVSSATVTLPNLVAGNYAIVVTDEATGCTAPASITINQPAAPLSATYAAVNGNCSVSTSAVTVTATGGTPIYRYSFVQDGAPVGTYSNNNKANLDPAVSLNWDVHVIDANNCTFKLDITISKDIVPTVTASATGQCFGVGSYTITATPGAGLVAPLTYSIDNGASYQAGNTFVITTPGTYTVRIKDGNGCTANSNVVIVDNILGLTAVLDKNITCSVPTAAQVTLTANGGSTPYTYESKEAAGAYTAMASNVFNTMTPGSYTFRVTDAKGCIFETTSPIIITAPVNPDITNVVQTALINCNGDATAAIAITIDDTKGQAPFVYTVRNTTTGVNYGTQTSGLAAGDYVVTVTDAKGCTDTFNINIAQPTPIVVSRTVTPITCGALGVSLGSITINSVSGGTPNYTYHVTGVNGYNKQISNQTGATAVFEVVDFGLYQIIITDANGCTNIEQNVLVASPPDDLDITVTAPPADCSSPGSAVVAINTTATGTITGPGPFHFAIYTGPGMVYTSPTALPWYNEDAVGSKKTTIPNLLPGVKYTFIVHDSVTGCYYFESATTPIPTNSTLTTNALIASNITCRGSADGKVTFTIGSSYASVTPITYEIFNSQSLVSTGITGTGSVPAGGILTLSNLGPLPFGNYFVLVKETAGATHAGCSVATVPFNITQSAIDLSLTASVSKNANCNANSGVITAIAKDGTAPYTYQLLLASAPAPTAATAGWASANTFNRDAGNYIAYVKDAYGCIKQASVTLTKDADPTITAPATICYDGTPFTITISGTVDPAIVGDATYSVNGSAFQTSPNFTFNASGVYTLVIKDGNGCTATTTYEVKPQLQLSVALTKELDCTPTPNAEITLTATGGYNTAYTYEYSVNGGGYTTMASNVLSTSVLGNYTFRVSDAKLPMACQATATLTLDPVQPTLFATVQTHVSCFGGGDGTITVNVTSGVGPYQYQLDGGTFQTSNVFTGVAAGNSYIITVRDAKSCLYPSAPIVITQPDALTATSVITAPLTCAAGNVPTKAIVTVTAVDGTSPYLYSFDNGVTYTSTNTYEVFAGTTFDVLVKDAKGCLFTLTNGVNIPALNPPTNMDITGTPIWCAPAANTTSTVTISNVINGVGTLQYEILSPIVVAKQTSATFAGLAANTYLFQVTDANGCTYKESYTISPVTNITIAGQLVSNVVCNGEANGAVKFTVGNYAGGYTAALTAGTGTLTTTGNTVNVTGLVPGTYTVRVTDAITGCIADASVIVTQPALLELDLISNVNANCNFGAKVSVLAKGGTPTYKYQFVQDGATPNPLDYDTVDNAVLNPLTNTQWDVYAIDANGCTVKIDVTIGEDAKPKITPSTVPYCYTGGPVAITIKGTYVGTPTYSIGNGYQSSPDFVLNAPGTYTFSIKDGNGCVVSEPYILDQELLLQASLTQDLTCAGSATITLLATQGTKTYAGFEVDFNGGGYVAATSPYTATAPGTYTFRVTDSKGCQAVSIPVIVTPTTTPKATFTQTNVSCVGGNDGSIIVTAADGILPYRYSINGGGFQTSNIFPNLSAGTYDIVIQDAKQCNSVMVQATITQPLALAATATLTQSLTCGTGNATQAAIVTVTVTAGTGTSPYQYSFNGGANYSTTNTFTTFNAGTVTVYVKDANNCVIATPIDVVIPALNPPTIDTITGTPIWCTPAANTTSTVTVNVSNGVGTLHYEILSPASAITNVSGAASGIFTGLNADTYLFQVTDANGCKDEAYYTVDPLANITIAGQLVNDVICNGDATGSVKFDVDNFTGTYTATLIGGPTTGTLTQVGKVVTLTNLPIGTYTVEVVDNVTGCRASAAVQVIQPAVLSLTLDKNISANCNSGAEVSVIAAGGTPNYRYQFILDTATPVTTDYTSSNSAVLNPALGLNWKAYVIDSKDCETFIPIAITLDPMPTGVTATVASQCPSLTGEYTFTVNVTSGVAPFEYSIGNGFQTSPTFTVKAAGIYDVTIRDANQCEVTVNAAVNISPALELDATITALPGCVITNNGIITATATGGSGTTNYRYTLDGGVIVTTTPAVFNNVTPGNHVIRVRDVVTNCVVIENVFVAPATNIVGLALAKTHVTCNGGNNGSITASIDETGLNDNPIYVYRLTGTNALGNAISRPNQQSPIFENLEAGDYTVTVTSGRGCEDSEDVRINQFDLIAVGAPVLVQYGCATGTNISNYATVSVGTVTGGSKTYTNYEFFRNGVSVQSGPQTVYTETDYLGGDYSVKVTDDAGCSGASVGTETINPFISLDVVNVSNVAITCISSEEITVSVTSTGGTPVLLNYNVTGTDNAYNQTKTNGNFTGLTVGSYIITVTNPATGCSIQKAHYVAEPNTFEIKANPIVKEVCFGDSNGSVELTFVDNQLNPSNEAGPFDYTITDGTNSILGTTTDAGPVLVSNLIAGTYSVTAKLKGGPECTVSTVFSIAQPSVQLTVATTKSDITCIPGKDGEISAFATGGWDNNYTYELVLGGQIVASNTNGNFTGLAEGIYTINAKDGKGCPAQTTVTLKVPDPIIVSAVPSVTTLSCFGDKSATITVNPPTGGQGSNYMYTLNILSATPVIVSGPQSDPVFTGLGAGKYSITVSDGFNCTATSAEIDITEPTEVIPSLVLASSQTCNTLSTLTLSATGGSAPYSYSSDGTNYNTFASPFTFSVPVGTYQYYIRDANGCVATISNEIKIDPLVPLTVGLDITNAVVKCVGEATGVIVAEAKGGLGNYSYTLETSAGVLVQGPQDNGRFENLIIGNYRVRVDSGDCRETSVNAEITQPAAALQPTFVPTNVTCFGENNGKIVVTTTGGTGTIKYAISPDLNQFDFISTFDKLAAGLYTIIVQDENGCYWKEDVEITQPNPLIVTEVANSMIPEVCKDDKDGAFSVEVKGGTGPYSVSLDAKTGPFTQGAVGQTIFDFTNLSGGVHTVYVKDAGGCINEFVENMPLPVVLNPTAEVTYDCVNNTQANMVVITVDESITNLADVDYSLDGSATYQPSNIFTNVAPGTHYVVARHTNGCEVPTANFAIKTYTALGIKLTDGKQEMNIISVVGTGGAPAYEYSFNGEPFTSDNKYKIYKSGDYKVIVRDQNGCTAEIIVPAIYVDVCLDNYFTPNGDGVYDNWGPGCTNIYNNLEFSIFDRYGRVIAKYHYGQKWDGRYNGEELPSGDYWYVLKLNDEKDNREFVGHFTLYR